MKLSEHPGIKIWPPQWGVVLKKVGREHPNTDFTFNSRAIVYSAYAKPYESDAIEVEVAHPSFERKVTGTVLVADEQDSKAFAAFLNSCRGLTIEQIEQRELP
jgi:hypothetical protein